MSRSDKRIREIYQKSRQIAVMSDKFMESWEYEYAKAIAEECAWLVEKHGYWKREFSEPSVVSATPQEIASMIRDYFDIEEKDDLS